MLKVFVRLLLASRRLILLLLLLLLPARSKPNAASPLSISIKLQVGLELLPSSAAAAAAAVCSRYSAISCCFSEKKATLDHCATATSLQTETSSQNSPKDTSGSSGQLPFEHDARRCAAPDAGDVCEPSARAVELRAAGCAAARRHERQETGFGSRERKERIEGETDAAADDGEG